MNDAHRVKIIPGRSGVCSCVGHRLKIRRRSGDCHPLSARFAFSFLYIIQTREGADEDMKSHKHGRSSKDPLREALQKYPASGEEKADPHPAHWIRGALPPKKKTDLKPADHAQYKTHPPRHHQ